MANLSNSSIHRYYHFCIINLKRRSSEVLCPEGQYNCGRKNVFLKFLYFTSNYEVHHTHTYMNVIKEWTKQSRFETMPLPAPAYNCLHLSPVPHPTPNTHHCHTLENTASGRTCQPAHQPTSPPVHLFTCPATRMTARCAHLSKSLNSRKITVIEIFCILDHG